MTHRAARRNSGVSSNGSRADDETASLSSVHLLSPKHSISEQSSIDFVGSSGPLTISDALNLIGYGKFQVQTLSSMKYMTPTTISIIVHSHPHDIGPCVHLEKTYVYVWIMVRPNHCHPSIHIHKHHLFDEFSWAADAMEALLLSFLVESVRDEWDLTPGFDGLIGAVVFVGIFIGCWIFGVISDSRGRRVAYLCTAVFTGRLAVMLVILLSLLFLLSFFIYSILPLGMIVFVICVQL